MYEHMTSDYILQRMLLRVPNNVDKRQGSIIYDALAPAATELAQMYNELDLNNNLSYADTASGELLERRTAEYGITRHLATKTKRQGLFFSSGNVAFDVPIGSRYSIESVNFIVREKIVTGEFEMESEMPGVIGNQYFGTLLPIDYVAGLTRAELADVLVPGAEDETDQALRQRYFAALNEQPFGGNIADYKQKIGAIPGVGGVKVYPAWAGGGTVKCTILAADFTEPSPTLIDDVQTAIDPDINTGEGLGLAPIGHSVTIVGVSDETIDVETTLTLASGVTINQVQEEIEAVIEAYLLSLRQIWANETQLIVRISQIEARILTISGITDIAGTELNGSAVNITLQADEIPEIGTVTLND